MIPEQIEESISEPSPKSAGSDFKIISSQSISGGSINQAFKINTSSGNYFLKYNDASRFPAMFEKEAKGLEILKENSLLKIPQVISQGESKDYSWILLEYITSAIPNENFWEDFGHKLAHTHKVSNSFYGLDHDNYMGSLNQSNIEHVEWVDFFIEERLERQVAIAFDHKIIDRSLVSSFENLYRSLTEIFPPEAPALLHGDLWNGNFICDDKGAACLIDPAVYYGHREIDIAMSTLFGGLDDAFYKAYNSSFPLENDWENRMDIYNLYPLLVHVNLFGSSYIASIKKILKKFR
ncbi:MAG: fructosamine kinase family protein [Bacteroidales bacterium]|nr:fructosamine kinase family protein [Bacteroidales bacterium]